MKKLVTSLLAGLFLIIWSDQLYSTNATTNTFTSHSTLAPPVILNLSGGTANVGDKVCLDLTVRDFQLIVGFQFSLQWNSTVLRFDSIERASINLPGLDAGSFNSVNASLLTCSWFNNTANPVNKMNDERIVSLCFTALSPGNANLQFTDQPNILEAYHDVDGEIELIANAAGLMIIGTPVDNCGTVSGLSFFASHETAGPGDIVCVEVKAQEFTDILSFQWSMTYDSDLLRFDTAYTINLPGFDYGSVGLLPVDTLTLTWIDPNPLFEGVTLPDCEPLFVLCFEVLGQNGDVSTIGFTDEPTSIEVGDANGNLLDADFYDGLVIISNTRPRPKVIAGDQTVEPDSQVCLDVRVEGFTDLTKLRYSMNWDQTKLEYVEVRNFNLNGLTAANFSANPGNGTLTFDWNAPGGNPISLTNGTSIYQVCFEAVGADGTTTDVNFTNTPLSSLVIAAPGDTLDLLSDGASVTIQAPRDCGTEPGFGFFMSHEQGAPGDIVCLEVTSQEFDTIGSLQWTMQYNADILRFDTAYSVSLPGFDIGSIGANNPGSLTFSWVDPTPDFRGITVADCEVLFKLCFEIIGTVGQVDSIRFTGNPLSIEVSNSDGTTLDPYFLNGSVTIATTQVPTPDPLRVNIQNKSVDEGDQVCLGVTVRDFKDLEKVQFSINWDKDALEYIAVQSLNLTGLDMSDFTANAANGTLTVNWDAAPGIPVTVNNGTVLFEMCFTAIGNGGTTTDVTFSDNPLVRFVQNNNDDTVAFQGTKGVVTIREVVNSDCGTLPGTSFYLPQESGETGQTVCLELKAKDFTSIGSLQWTYTYDPTVLRFDTTYRVSLPGYDIGNINIFQPGVILFSWVDPSPTFSGVTIPDCEILVELCFEIIGQSGAVSDVQITNSPNDIEISDKDGNIVQAQYAPGKVTVGGAPCVFSVSGSVTDVICKGSSTGIIDLNVSGQTTGYTYLWSYNAQNTQDLINVPAGVYMVSVTNCNNTTKTYSFTVNEPATGLGAEVLETTNNLCFADKKGSISVTASGGWGSNYTYHWSNNLRDSNLVENLSAGQYGVTVVDERGCQVSIGPINITGPTTPFQVTGTAVDESCFNSRNGSINITASGGTLLQGESYQYNWNIPGNPTLEDQVNIPPGIYTVTVTDSYDCTAVGTFEVKQARDIVIEVIEIRDAPNGLINIRVTGGTPGSTSQGYAYNWSGPNNFSAINEDISNLCPGTYSVTVTDGKNCVKNATFEINGACVTLDTVIVTRTCPGLQNGQIEVRIVGGSNPSIRWIPASLPNNFTISNLGAGNYTFTIYEGVSPLLTQSVVLQEYPQMVITTDNVKGSVTGFTVGAIAVSIAGGSGNYSYNWTPGNLQTQDINNLAPGDYTLVVTDNATKCTQTTTINVPDLAAVSIIQSQVTPTTCPGGNDGSFRVSFPTGTPPFTVSVVGHGAAIVTSDNTLTYTGFGPGVYTVNVIDDNGTAASVVVVVTQPNPFDDTAIITPRTSQQGGKINLTITGGTPPYNYTWNTGDRSEDLFNLQEDCYKATVTDNKGCVHFTDEYCVQFFRITSSNVVNVNCANDTTGMITISIDGGNEPYQYEWTRDQSVVGRDSVLRGVGSGEYYVRVFGSLGTVITQGPFIITAKSDVRAIAVPRTNFGGFNIACFGSSNGMASVTPTGGVGNYSYRWSNNSTQQVANNLPAGIHTVTVTDALGCKATATVEMTQPEQIIVSSEKKDVACAGDKNGEIRLFVNGGIPISGTQGYRYTWEAPGLDGPTARLLSEGIYEVTISDAFDCSVVQEIEILGPREPLRVSVETTDDDGLGSGSAFARVVGGTPPYQYRWHDIAPPNNISNPLIGLTPGFYTVTVTDNSGCNAAGTGEVRDFRLDCLTTRVVLTPDGDGLNEEFIIYCIENFPDNHLEIFNRWGQLVFSADNYDNTWAGTSRKGEELPEGGYFFIFEYRDRNNQLQQLKGSFTILKN